MCKEEVLLLFEQIQDSLDTIITRAIPVNTADDFTHSPDGMMRLDSICMLLVTIGEAIKNIDKLHINLFYQNILQLIGEMLWDCVILLLINILTWMQK